MHTTRKRKIRSEGGITQIALDNGAILRENHGTPVWVRLTYDVKDWYVVEAGYSDGTKHRFTGLGWGYSGEGPRGLESWCSDNEVPLTMAEIEVFDNSSPIENIDKEVPFNSYGLSSDKIRSLGFEFAWSLKDALLDMRAKFRPMERPSHVTVPAGR